MPRFRVLKEWKKWLKRKRRHIWSLGAVVGFFLLATLVGSWLAHRVITMNQPVIVMPAEAAPVWMDNQIRDENQDSSKRDKTLHALQRWQGQVELVLQRTYLCGEETRKLGMHSTSVAVDLLKAHRDWAAEFDSTGRVMMKQLVDDLSPQCRKTAYIGMDKDGNLSLYDGLPRREKVIRTFFQLDVEMLESRLSDDRLHELERGIRVTDKDEYNSVLSTFNDFARLRS